MSQSCDTQTDGSQTPRLAAAMAITPVRDPLHQPASIDILSAQRRSGLGSSVQVPNPQRRGRLRYTSRPLQSANLDHASDQRLLSEPSDLLKSKSPLMEPLRS